MLERAVELIKLGNPDNWPKTKENKGRCDEMARILQGLTGSYIDCGWCNRSAVYKHLKKWLEGNGHL